jgi:GT2 family glycosyltransferase
LVATVEAVCRQVPAPDLVEVHANAAGDADLMVIRSAVEPVQNGVEVVVRGSSENLGFSGAHNATLSRLFSKDFAAVLVLNPDLILEPNALAELAAAEAAASNATLCGPLLELADPGTMVGTGQIDTAGIRWAFGGRHVDALQGEPLARAPAVLTEVAGISGACLYVGVRAFEAVVGAGGEFFDEDFIAYREDAELAYRAQLLGVPSLIVPRARGRHARALRGTSRGHDPFIDRLGVRNRFLIAFKYGSARPGGVVGAGLRDVVVVGGVLIRERSSIGGLREAWALRGRMRAKGRGIRASARGRE